MRLSILPILLAAAASALPTRMDSGVDRRAVPLAAPAPRDEHLALAAEHARARRAGPALAHGSPLRKVRRLKTKRARKCRPRTSSSTATPAPTGGEWSQTWSKPHSSSDKGDDKDNNGSSSHWESRPDVDGGSTDWSGSATTTTEHGRPSPSSGGDESPSPSPSPSPTGGESESPSPSPSDGGESQSASASGPQGQSASSTSSGEQPKPTDGGQGGGGELDHMLFPNGRGTAFWTTSSGGLSCKL